MESRQQGRLVEREARSLRLDAEAEAMLSRQWDSAEAILAQHRDLAIAGDRACEARDREANDRAAARRDEEIVIFSRDGTASGCRPADSASTEEVEGPPVGGRRPRDNFPDDNGPYYTRRLLERADIALGCARSLQDGEHDGIDVEGDLCLRGWCSGEPRGMAAGRQTAVGAVSEEGRGGGASEWVPATFQDRRHILTLLVRGMEDFRRISAHEREHVALMTAYEREDEAVVRRLTEEAVDRVTRRFYEDESDAGYSDSSDGE